VSCRWLLVCVTHAIYTPIVQVASSCEKQQRTLFLTAMLFDYSSIRLGVALGSPDWENRFPDLASNLLEIKEVESQQDENVQRDWTRREFNYALVYLKRKCHFLLMDIITKANIGQNIYSYYYYYLACDEDR